MGTKRGASLKRPFPCPPCPLPFRGRLPPPRPMVPLLCGAVCLSSGPLPHARIPPSPAPGLYCASVGRPEWGPRPSWHLSPSCPRLSPWAAENSQEVPPGTRPAPEKWHGLSESKPKGPSRKHLHAQQSVSAQKAGRPCDFEGFPQSKAIAPFSETSSGWDPVKNTKHLKWFGVRKPEFWYQHCA